MIANVYEDSEAVANQFRLVVRGDCHVHGLIPLGDGEILVVSAGRLVAVVVERME